MTNRKIAVVGAGIAGLTAAYFLKQAGYTPLVFEKSDQVGGRMMTDTVNGLAIDGGAQFLMDAYPVLTGLIDQRGLSSEFIETNPFWGTVRNGKIRKVLTRNVLSPLRTGLLSLPGWFRLGWRMIQLMPKVQSFPLNDCTAWTEYDDVDAGIWSQSYFGREVTDYIMEPPVGGFFFHSLSNTSRALPIGITSTFLYQKKKTMILANGINSLPRSLASQLDVRLNTPVSSVSISKSGVELGVDKESIVVDRVILAATAPTAKALYEEPTAIERELLATPYSSSIVIAVAVKDTFRPDPELMNIYCILIPEKERGVIASMGIQGSGDKTRLGKAKVFAAFLSSKAASEMMNWKDEAIVPVVLGEMDKYYAHLSENILFTKVYRWREALAMSPVGRYRKVAQYRQSVNGSTKVFLAGDYMGMSFTEGAAETGKWAALSMMKNLA
jgi:protoporphyrinogen/coproporphyrinogen III oxidase